MRKKILYLEYLATRRPSGQNLEHVSLSLREGEMLSVTGISESGVSVLADVICGRLSPDAGTIYLEGVPVSYRSVNEARRLGIYEITHRTSVVNNMTAAENLAVLRKFSWKHLQLRRRSIDSVSQEVFAHYGIGCEPHTRGSRMQGKFAVWVRDSGEKTYSRI